MIEQYKNKSRVLRFFLQNASEGIVELYNAPDGWDESGYSFSRSEFYGGVFRKYALDKLAFVKEAKDFIKKVEDAQGFEAEINLIIWEKDYSIYSYFELFRGALKLVQKDEDRLKTNVPVVDSSFEDKLLNREDVKIITTKRTDDEVYTDIDGGVILGFSNENRLITLPERVDALSSVLTSDRSLTYASNANQDPIIPLLLVSDSNDDNVQGNTNSYKQASGAFYINSTSASTAIQLQGSVDINVDINKSVTTKDDIKVILYIIDNTDTITKSVEITTVKTLIAESGFFNEKYSIVGDIDIDELIPENNYVQIGVMVSGTSGSMSATGSIIDFSLATQTGTIPQVNIQTELVHEAFARIGQKTTGLNSPFYSELFGRKNSEPRSYTYDGEDSLLAITNGALIRGFGMTNRATSPDTIAPLSISLKDLFSTCRIKRPIGMGIETIDGNKVFRIEELPYFFDTRIALTIDNATDIIEEYNDNLIYNEFEAGYAKFESDEIRNGLYDYNTKSLWANAISTLKDKLSIISKYSASNASINQARLETREEKPTTDSKYDDINFIIDVVENPVPNSVLNPNADEGTANWSITSGVSTQNLIGNPKFVLEAPISGQVSMSQILTGIESLVLSFSYAVISSDELTFTPTAIVSIILNDTSVKYLNSNGDWVDESVFIYLPSIKGVQESQLQSMSKFEIAANESRDDINSMNISFQTAFLEGSTGTNQYIIDDIYASDSAKYRARTTEGFDSVTGIVNSNDSYNIDLTPARTLRRWGAVLRAFLDDKLNTNYAFSDTEKNSTLVSKLTSEGFTVSEGQDVLVNDLEEPLWGIKKKSFNALLTAAQRKDINSTFDDGKPKVNAIVAYRGNTSEAYNYDWIDDLNLGGLNGVAKFETRPISKYVTIAENTEVTDDDLIIFTDNDLIEFTAE